MGIKKIINKDVTKDFDFSCFHLRLNRLPSAKQRCAIACVDSVLWRQFPAILFVNQSKGDDANGFFPAQCYGSVSSSRKVSHEWFGTP